MLRCTSRLAQAVKPISRDEFLTALTSTCPAIFQAFAGRPIGLAVSGGVDSMALAAMCSRYLSDDSKRFHAFIVDHGLRAGSSEEAQDVGKILIEQCGIPTDILRIHVTHSGTNLETRARIYRYHALGRACLDRNIPLILLGHHEDDEYENMLWRFSNGHANPAFVTMRREGDMPEIEGVHGVHSGGELKVLPIFNRQPYWQGKPLTFPNRVVGIESGGLRIARPLLDFSKERIVSTCEEFGVPWKEDLSNHDRTLTPRNAIRYILKNHRLPSALSKPRLLQSRTALREFSQIMNGLVRQMFNLCDVTLDVRNGTARVTTPNPTIMTSLADDTKLAKYPGSARISEIVPAFLRMVQSILTPTDTTSTLQLATAANAFTSHYAALEQNPSKLQHSEFQLNQLIVQAPKYEQEPGEDSQRSQCTWVITKSRFSRRALAGKGFDSHTMAYRKYLDIPIPPHSENHEPEFYEWDRRFWIRVHHHFKEDMWIRPLTELRLKLIRELISRKYFDFSIPELNLHAGTEKQLSEVLRKLAPGDVRFTLPIVEAPPLPGGTFSMPIAIPTLGIRLTPHGELRERWNWPDDISWEVRYVRVDLGPNWEDRLGAEDEEWSWNKSTKAAKAPDEEHEPHKIESRKVINSSDELRMMVLSLRGAAAN